MMDVRSPARYAADADALLRLAQEPADLPAGRHNER